MRAERTQLPPLCYSHTHWAQAASLSPPHPMPHPRQWQARAGRRTQRVRPTAAQAPNAVRPPYKLTIRGTTGLGMVVMQYGPNGPDCSRMGRAEAVPPTGCNCQLLKARVNAICAFTGSSEVDSCTMRAERPQLPPLCYSHTHWVQRALLSPPHPMPHPRQWQARAGRRTQRVRPTAAQAPKTRCARPTS